MKYIYIFYIILKTTILVYDFTYSLIFNITKYWLIVLMIYFCYQKIDMLIYDMISSKYNKYRMYNNII